MDRVWGFVKTKTLGTTPSSGCPHNSLKRIECPKENLSDEEVDGGWILLEDESSEALISHSVVFVPTLEHAESFNRLKSSSNHSDQVISSVNEGLSSTSKVAETVSLRPPESISEEIAAPIAAPSLENLSSNTELQATLSEVNDEGNHRERERFVSSSSSSSLSIEEDFSRLAVSNTSVSSLRRLEEAALGMIVDKKTFSKKSLLKEIKRRKRMVLHSSTGRNQNEKAMFHLRNYKCHVREHGRKISRPKKSSAIKRKTPC